MVDLAQFYKENEWAAENRPNLGCGSATDFWIGQIFTLCYTNRKRDQGPVIRKPINANPQLKVNQGFHLTG